MKGFKNYMEDTTTVSVAGAGDDKIVPVHMKKKKKRDMEVLKRLIDKREASKAYWSK